MANWTKEKISNLIKNNDTMVIHSLLQLYSRQTEIEKSLSQTRVHNRKGFNAPDSSFLSSLVHHYNWKGFLSEKQIFYARIKLFKYVGQLTDIANEIEDSKLESVLTAIGEE